MGGLTLASVFLCSYETTAVLNPGIPRQGESLVFIPRVVFAGTPCEAKQEFGRLRLIKNECFGECAVPQAVARVHWRWDIIDLGKSVGDLAHSFNSHGHKTRSREEDLTTDLWIC